MNELEIKYISAEPYCFDLFTDKTKLAVSNKTNNLVHQFNVLQPNGTYVRNFCKVLFLGYTCTLEEVADTMEILATKLNELAEKDFIIASLTTMSVVPFADPNGSPVMGLPNCSINGKRMYGVVSYLAILQEGEEYIKKYMPYLEMPEGGSPKICTNEPLDRWESFSTYAISEE
jgi:hypothetical protein